MKVEILTPEKILFSDEVHGIQLPGVTGLFEVLEQHAPIVSALKAGQIKVLKNKNNQTIFFDIQSGFVEVISNCVTVLAEGVLSVDSK
jgi:F-type H+-transporting ATPase subunit epsilon